MSTPNCPTNVLDLTGQTYGQLLVLAYAGRRNLQTYWRCRCLACGSEREYLMGNLRSGQSTQCRNCPAKQRRRVWDAPGYLSWKRMPERGKVCKRWQTFEQFIADMGEPPPGKPYLLRIDSTKAFSPSNCIWWCHARARILVYQGRALPLDEWVKELRITKAGMFARLQRMPLHKAMTTPVQNR